MTDPLVSIVIPTFNLMRYLKDCIDSIKRNTAITYEIIVVDNGSCDGTIDYLRTVPEICGITNGYNLGFAKACNQGFRASSGKYIVFLNNDTLVTEGWLEPLVNCVEKNSTIGAAASKLLYPFTNIVQHAGICFTEREGCLEPCHIYYRQRDSYAGVNKTRQFQAITGACLLVKREVFERIGGFDEQYLNSHEDIDLCLRIGEAGLRIMYCPESLVYHYESVTEGRLDNVVKSRDRFYRKWQGKLREDYFKYYEEDEFKTLPVVSIIMVTFNEIDYTRQCIEKIFNITQVPFEIIIIDTGSTDGTREYLTQCPRIKYVFSDVNTDYSEHRNNGIKYSLSGNIVFLNRNIAIVPGWIENLLDQPNNRKLIRHPDNRDMWDIACL